MARPLNRLTTRQAATLKAPGRHADGGGLYLRVTSAGGRSWVFMASVDGRRAEIGLGPVSAVPLSTARSLAANMREAIALGRDPRSVLVPVPTAPAVPTFGEFAESHIASIEHVWKNVVHRQQWRSSLRDHAPSLSSKRVDEITTSDILAVLQPIWLTKPETAQRVRARIERILDAAKALNLRPSNEVNPALWRGHMSALLPARAKASRGHHAALPWAEAPAFYNQLAGRDALAARCLMFVILTAARSGEALGATWGEIDLTKRLWTVPAGRMKAGAEHHIPLSDPALAVLESVRPVRIEPRTIVFAVAGAARSNMAMAMLLRRMGRPDITVHGFRSTFRDWAGENTNHPHDVVEHALAHTVGNKTTRAYRRETSLERRRPLMADWAAYVGGQSSDD